MQVCTTRNVRTTSCGERTWSRIPAVAGISNTPIGDSLPTGRVLRTGVATNFFDLRQRGDKGSACCPFFPGLACQRQVCPFKENAKEGTRVSCPFLFSSQGATRRMASRRAPGEPPYTAPIPSGVVRVRMKSNNNNNNNWWYQGKEALR